MGTGTSQILKKHEEDLSPQTLSQTTLDDKVWLGVTEENLFNESFTNEKYYLLHSRRRIEGLDVHESSPLEKWKDKTHKEDHEQAKKRAETLLGIVDGDPHEQHTNTINRLVHELIHNPNSSLFFKRTIY